MMVRYSVAIKVLNSPISLASPNSGGTAHDTPRAIRRLGEEMLELGRRNGNRNEGLLNRLQGDGPPRSLVDDVKLESHC